MKTLYFSVPSKKSKINFSDRNLLTLKKKYTFI